MNHRTLTTKRQTAAEARVAELSCQADDLLAETALLRAEAMQLYDAAYEITAALARGDVHKAYAISLDDAEHHALGAQVA